jgi:hypothetical protein
MLLRREQDDREIGEIPAAAPQQFDAIPGILMLDMATSAPARAAIRGWWLRRQRRQSKSYPGLLSPRRNLSREN